MMADRSDKPSRTVHFDTGMAMTLSCSPARDGGTQSIKRPVETEPPQQRGSAK